MRPVWLLVGRGWMTSGVRVREPYCQRCMSSGLRVRERFQTPVGENLNWFPGHMRTGLLQMQAKLRSMDAVVEVHDARVPFSGRNVQFSRLLTAARPHLLVLNKCDLVERSELERAARQLTAQPVVFINCLDQQDPGLRGLAARLTALVGQAGHRPSRASPREYNCMVVGVPNVGKSSLINALRGLHLRRSRATQVGAQAGVTRSVLNRIKVSERPLLFVRDTPGILAPQIGSPEAGLRLALCAALQDHLVGPQLLADYLLFWLNRHGNFSYVPYMGVSGPTDEVRQLLASCAVARGWTLRVRDVASGQLVVRPDLHAAALHMIRGFRTAQFGKLMLDSDLLQQREPTDDQL